MDDKDHVFARFKNNKPVSVDRREVMTIPRRAGASGSRTVEVVRARLGVLPTAKAMARRPGPHDCPAPREALLSPERPAPLAAAVEPDLALPPLPVAHVMPAYEPSVRAAEVATPGNLEAPDTALETTAVERPLRKLKARRRFADPFDSADEGTNCLRCGYTVEPAREKRGLSVCAGCG